MIEWAENPKGNGILVACDSHVEWLLPWWWKRYSACNSLPVAFVDLGMTQGAQLFCQKRGQVIPMMPLKMPSLASGKKEEQIRFKGWYKKPFAFLLTPFEQTLWLDCDCEVLKPLDDLFELEGKLYLAPDTENAHLKERSLGTILSDETLYNSGVVLYRHGLPLLEKWAQIVAQSGESFFSDQHVLSRIIYEQEESIHHLHENYNWRMSQGLNIHASIVHWAGSWGKEYIRRYGGLGDELAHCLKKAPAREQL